MRKRKKRPIDSKFSLTYQEQLEAVEYMDKLLSSNEWKLSTMPIELLKQHEATYNDSLHLLDLYKFANGYARIAYPVIVKYFGSSKKVDKAFCALVTAVAMESSVRALEDGKLQLKGHLVQETDKAILFNMCMYVANKIRIHFFKNRFTFEDQLTWNDVAILKNVDRMLADTEMLLGSMDDRINDKSHHFRSIWDDQELAKWESTINEFQIFSETIDYLLKNAGPAWKIVKDHYGSTANIRAIFSVTMANMITHIAPVQISFLREQKKYADNLMLKRGNENNLITAYGVYIAETFLREFFKDK